MFCNIFFNINNWYFFDLWILFSIGVGICNIVFFIFFLIDIWLLLIVNFIVVEWKGKVYNLLNVIWILFFFFKVVSVING